MICCRQFLLLLLAAPRRASRIKDLGPRDLVVVVHSGLVEDGKAGRWPWPRLSSAALPLGLP